VQGYVMYMYINYIGLQDSGGGGGGGGGGLNAAG